MVAISRVVAGVILLVEVYCTGCVALPLVTGCLSAASCRFLELRDEVNRVLLKFVFQNVKVLRCLHPQLVVGLRSARLPIDITFWRRIEVAILLNLNRWLFPSTRYILQSCQNIILRLKWIPSAILNDRTVVLQERRTNTWELHGRTSNIKRYGIRLRRLISTKQLSSLRRTSNFFQEFFLQWSILYNEDQFLFLLLFYHLLHEL